MKLRIKLALLGLGAGAIALQAATCARFWGDVIGDQIILRAI
jgi:hypothetical protein